VGLGAHAQDPRPILGRHGIDRVRDQVQKHLLQLDSISSYLRYLCIRLGLDQYPMPLQIAARQGNGFPDEVVDVEQSSVPGLLLEHGTNASDHRPRAMAISDDPRECRLRFLDIGHRAIKPAQARIGVRYHPRQWLPDLVSNRGRDRVGSVRRVLQKRLKRPWYAGDVQRHQPFGEGANHDQDRG